MTELSHISRQVLTDIFHFWLQYIKLHLAKLSDYFFRTSDRNASSIPRYTRCQIWTNFGPSRNASSQIELVLRAEARNKKSDSFARWSFIFCNQKCNITVKTRLEICESSCTMFLHMGQKIQRISPRAVQQILDFPDFPEIHPTLGTRISELKRS